MIKTVKHALPIVVLIMLSGGAIGLWIHSSERAILIGGLGAAFITALLFYAVIRWDEALVQEEREKQQLADVVDHATDAIVISDAAGQILYANRLACESYGIRPQPQSGETISLIGLQGGQKESVFSQVLQGEPWHGELVHTCSDARQIHLVNVFRLEEFQGHAPALVSIGRDLTRWKELEKKLMHSQKLAAVGELAAGVAHEINNPMAAIQSQIGLAKDLITLKSLPSDTGQEVLSCIDDASKQVERCSDIVNSLLGFSRRQEPEVSDINVEAAIEQAIHFVRSLSKMSDLELVHQACCNMPPIKSDLNSISQILVNLILNAADATGLKGTIRIEAHQRPDDTITIDVIDNGCGIAPHHLERVFEPFFSTKSPGQGTGLGLSISYGMAQSLRGDLSLSCPAEGGTCASLTLPFE